MFGAESFLGKLRRNKVVGTSNKVFTTLYVDGKLGLEATGAARAVVTIAQNPLSRKLKPVEIKTTAKALAAGLQDPFIQTTTLFDDALPALPVLAEEYHARKPAQDQQLGANEVKIDDKTTLIQPDNIPHPLAVSRRDFFKDAAKFAVIVGLPLSVTVGGEYLSIKSIIDTTVVNERFEQELSEAKAKFNKGYPVKPTEFKSADEIKESLRYKQDRDQTWQRVYEQINQKYYNRGNLEGTVGAFIITPLVGLITFIMMVGITMDRNDFD